MLEKYFSYLKNNLRIIVVNPIYPGNVGSIARLMKNFGITELYAVNPCNILDIEAKRMAMNGYDILLNATICDEIDEAIKDLHILFATSARTGRKRISKFTPQSAAKRIIEIIPNLKVGVIFGQEDKGLDNSIIAKSQNLITIPTASFHSINLSQSVAIILYEIFAQINEEPKAQETIKPELAKREALELMFNHIESVLFEIGFLDPENPQRMMLALRDIFERAQLKERDIRVIRGIFHRVHHFKTYGKPPR
ncbi:MAG: RNA methyltransferase [Candidatus Hydrogenedentota bacterium]